MIWGDTAIFINPTDPDNCILTNRFKRGQRVGFRMTAIDGGTGEVENTATLVAHVTYAGKTVDAPMRWRGAAGPSAPAPRGYLRSPAELWTGSWTVPDDAPIGRISYTVTATDKFGRKATFTPFSAEASQLVIVPEAHERLAPFGLPLLALVALVACSRTAASPSESSAAAAPAALLEPRPDLIAHLQDANRRRRRRRDGDRTCPRARRSISRGER